MRITTDIEGLDRMAPASWTVHVHSAEKAPAVWKRMLLLARDAVRSDYLVLHFEFMPVLLFGLLLSFSRCRLVTLDFFIPVLKRWMTPLVGVALRRVFRLLVYFRDARVFVERYGADPGKFHYVPFKINAWPLIQAAAPFDGGYVFSGGRSRRDFAALFSALGELGYPCKVLAGAVSELSKHGSSLAAASPPPNVEILHDDSAGFFVSCMAGARVVVIPLLKDAITQAGIGVYISAMALRKCVIVSTGLGVEDVLLEKQAMIVPAGDRDALRDAIRLAWENEAVREAYARRGYEYAIALGDADNLRRSVLAALPPV
jgi:glycosyltransferase involved in cell wall biosynthesis